MSAGMALSRRFWEQCGEPAFRALAPELLDRIAVGLVGEGSECFGFDDELSRDHDWGPGFCVWLEDGELPVHGPLLQAIYDGLPDRFEGYAVKRTPGRVGVFGREAFFRHFLGCIPERPTDWLAVPEYALATCTGGQVFRDPPGRFTQTWQYLRQPPEPVRQKKLAARCVTMLQSGQYNLPRCRRRGDNLAASLAVGEFITAAAGAMLLLNGRWAPFYKWLPASLRALPGPGPELERQLTCLASCPEAAAQDALVTCCCDLVADELRRQGLTALPGSDMQRLGLDIQSHITDEELRRLPVLVG